MEPEITIHFEDLDPSIRDRVIAFVFDHQRKERRRELDADAARQDGSSS